MHHRRDADADRQDAGGADRLRNDHGQRRFLRLRSRAIRQPASERWIGHCDSVEHYCHLQRRSRLPEFAGCDGRRTSAVQSAQALVRNRLEHDVACIRDKRLHLRAQTLGGQSDDEHALVGVSDCWRRVC